MENGYRAVAKARGWGLAGWVQVSDQHGLISSPHLFYMGAENLKSQFVWGRCGGFTAAGSSLGSWSISSRTESVYSTNTATTNSKITLSYHPKSLLYLQVVSGLDFLNEVFPLSYMTSQHLQRGSCFGKLRIRGQVTRLFTQKASKPIILICDNYHC